MFASIALVARVSDPQVSLAAAYGIAISVTMVITTLLFFFLERDYWKWHPAVALVVAGVFLSSI